MSSQKLLIVASVIFFVASCEDEKVVPVTSPPPMIEAPTAGQVAYFSFSGNFRDTVNQHEAIAFGAGFTDDISGDTTSAAYFDGASYLVIPNSPQLNFGTGDFSISLWLKTSDTSQQMILQKGRINGPKDPQYWVRLNDAHGDLTFLTGDGMPPSALCTNNGVVANDYAWHHLVAMRQGEKLQVYLDTIMISEIEGYVRNVDNNQTLKIGTQNFYGKRNFFTGSIDELRIYNRALSTEEIKTLHLIK